MTGHFTSYETRTNHELATSARSRIALMFGRAHNSIGANMMRAAQCLCVLAGLDPAIYALSAAPHHLPGHPTDRNRWPDGGRPARGMVADLPKARAYERTP